MPVKVPDGLPAIERLRKEHIFIISDSRADRQDIRPLKIGILNLMPVKESTEVDILRLLSNSPLQIEVDLIETATYRGSHTPISHMDTFYIPWPRVRNRFYDGFIITGAPVEDIDFENVNYWEELKQIMDWCTTNVTSTLYICWAALAGLYHHYGIAKLMLPKKLSGVYPHMVTSPGCELMRGFDDGFMVPHSRNSKAAEADIKADRRLTVASESREAGIHCVIAKEGREIFITGHSEYSPETLDNEYHRDLAKGLEPDMPENYYIDNDPAKGIDVKWRAHANLLFSNWLNYYVYQLTPYILGSKNTPSSAPNK